MEILQVVILQTIGTRGGKFYWWMTPEFSEKTIDQPQITDQLLLH
jgi:hypothetical protein